MEWLRLKRVGVLCTLTSLLLLSVLASIPQPVLALSSTTIQVSASTDDATRWGATSFSTTQVDVRVGSGTAYKNGLKFDGVPVPPNSIVNLARLKVKAKVTSSGTSFATTVLGEANVNPATFSTYGDYDSRTQTGSSVTWSVPVTWTAETIYQSSNIEPIITEIIALPGWASGNSMVFFWESPTSPQLKTAYSYDGASSKAAWLYIEYYVPVWVTINHNNSNAFMYEGFTPQVGFANGTVIQAWEDNAILFGSMQNGSWLFQNITADSVAYTDNPATITLPAYNITVWIYIQPYTSMGSGTDDNLVIGGTLGAVVMGIISLTYFLTAKKKSVHP